MDEIVKFELIDCVCLETTEALSDVAEKVAKLVLVVRADEFVRHPTLSLGVGFGIPRFRHTSTLGVERSGFTEASSAGTFRRHR